MIYKFLKGEKMKNKIVIVWLIMSFLSLSSQLMSCSPPITEKPSNDNAVMTPVETPSKATFAEEIASYGKPVLVDFGMESCTPCKMMVPVLEDLETNYKQDIQTIFVHVGNEQEKTKEFGIQMIPTQIFFDATGNELERHTGFISKEDILATFQKYGITITK